MAETQNTLLADLIIDSKKSADSGLYISEMTFTEGISQIGKAVLTICSNSLCLKHRGTKDQNGKKTEGLLDYLGKKATICFLDDKNEISRTFTGKITSVTHLGVSNTESGNLYKYEFIVEPGISDMRLAHHTRQIKKSIEETLKEILSTYYGDATIDFAVTKPDTNIYLFSQQHESDYDFFVRLLTQFGLSFFVCSQKNEHAEEYYEQVIISDGKVFELPSGTRSENDHKDRELKILVNKSSKTYSDNIRISSWKMSNALTIDGICKTDSLIANGNDKRLWFLDSSMAAPHSETLTDAESKENVANNYLNSIRNNSSNWLGKACLNDFQATDVLNILDFYSPCNFDSKEKEESALHSDDTIRARIISLRLVLTNVLPFEVASSTQSASSEVIFRCAEISNEASTAFTTVNPKTGMATAETTASSESAEASNAVLASVSVSNDVDNKLCLSKATVCYNPNTTADLSKLPKKNAQIPMEIDQKTGESYFYAKIDGTDCCSEVLFTMPLAGLGQGLYRYPRIGERILVLGSKDTRSVLHSYLPDTNTMPFFQYNNVPTYAEAEKILEDAGKLEKLSDTEKKNTIENYIKEQENLLSNQKKQQSVATVLRHSSDDFMNSDTEAQVADSYMSEESTGAFTPKLKPLDREVSGAFKSTNYSTKDIKYSEIGMYSGSVGKDGAWVPETLRIQTPGNQFNHTGLTSINTANSFVFTTPNATQGVNFGSFNVIDIGSVIIDVRKSIILRVGGNMISISEKGISLISQTTCTESTPYDSMLSLSPIGASLSGLEVNVSSKISTNVTDGMGATLALAKGAASLKGHTVDLSTVGHASINFEIFTSAWDAAKYVARFIADQVNMKKRLDIGYNDMVKDGYFNPQPLSYRMTGRTAAEKKGLATYNTIWNVIMMLVKMSYMKKSVIAPPRGSMTVMLTEVILNMIFGIFDGVMALLGSDVWGVGELKDLTPEEVQRQITITNFIKIATKAVFVGIKYAAYKAYSKGSISYLMMDPELIRTFSSDLKADFVNVEAIAHNVPLNPFLSKSVAGLQELELAPDNPVKAAAMSLETGISEATGAGKATAFAGIMKASAKVPAFALKMEKGSVGLNSNALVEFKSKILAGLANLDVNSVIETKVTAKSVAQNKISFTAPVSAISATGMLDVSSTVNTKIGCGPNSISISPADMKMTSAMLDMQAATLQAKANAALNIEGPLCNIKSEALQLKGKMVNASVFGLLKVG